MTINIFLVAALLNDRKTITFKVRTNLADSGQGSVGSLRTVVVSQPSTADAVHGVRGDGVAELLEGVISVPALLDLMKQLGQLTGHSVIWSRDGEDDGVNMTVYALSFGLNFPDSVHIF